MESTLETNKALVRRYVKEVLELANQAALEELVSEDFKNRSFEHRGEKRFGRERLGEDGIFNVRKEYPGMSIDVLDQVAEGDKVVTRMQISYESKGLFARSSKPKVLLILVEIARIENGKIQEIWQSIDEPLERY